MRIIKEGLDSTIENRIKWLSKRVGYESLLYDVAEEMDQNELDRILKEVEKNIGAQNDDILSDGEYKVIVDSVDYVGDLPDGISLDNIELHVYYDSELFDSFKEAVESNLDLYLTDTIDVDGFARDFTYRIENQM